MIFIEKTAISFKNCNLWPLKFYNGPFQVYCINPEESYIDSSRYASRPIRRCLFIDFIIRSDVDLRTPILTSAPPRSIWVLSGRQHIMSNTSIVNNCIIGEHYILFFFAIKAMNKKITVIRCHIHTRISFRKWPFCLWSFLPVLNE